MSLAVVGINHKTARLEIRERVAFNRETYPHKLLSLLRHPDIDEIMLLSTCNRTELYAEVRQAGDLFEWLRQHCQMPPEEAEKSLYCHHDEAAVAHILRVTNGLDSMVIGEQQIFGQMKKAFTLAAQLGSIGRHLHSLFQYIFSVTKQVRDKTEIGKTPVSVAFIATNLAKHIFNDLFQARILLIGAGQTCELMARYLRDHQVKNILIAARSRKKAAQLAQQFDGKGIALQDIPNHLATADIIISATSSALPLLGKGTVESALQARKNRPILMLDLASPRDIEVEVAQLENAYLYNLDDLSQMIRDGLNHRQAKAHQAEEMIAAYANYYIRYLKSLDADEMIKEHQQQARKHAQKLIKKATSKIHHGNDLNSVLDELTHTLTQKLFHCHYTKMREAALQGDTALLDVANTLLVTPSIIEPSK